MFYSVWLPHPVAAEKRLGEFPVLVLADADPEVSLAVRPNHIEFPYLRVQKATHIIRLNLYWRNLNAVSEVIRWCGVEARIGV